MLYLVATPIGNLADLSFRALDVLRNCHYILCEDTRYSQRLLNHYQIKKKLKSFHSFNESKELAKVLSDLQEGQDIALISDAGTPLIADPGFTLVQRCKEEHIPFTLIPGANAALVALILSGFPPLPFQVLGFLPKKEKELTLTLVRIFAYQGTSICYESPHRLLDTLTLIKKLSPGQLLCVARELTKLHEECLRASVDELIAHFSQKAPRGEITLVFPPSCMHTLFKEFTSIQLVEYFKRVFGLSVAEAIKITSELQHIPKKTIYKDIHFSSLEK